MNELGTSPPPQVSTSPSTRTSLATWWKSFKQRHNDGQSLEPPPPGGGFPARPRLPHQSHSFTTSGVSSSSPADRDLTAMAANSAALTAAAGSAGPPLLPSDAGDSPIFGVPLVQSIKYAKVSISLSDPSGEQFVYGHIPIVVAKCGVYLKKNATTVEGIFRLSGSARRIKELQTIFNSAPRFGKGLDWSGYNVHDAANVLRRYLNNLPEPIVPLSFYERFRDPLREFSSIVEVLDAQATSAPAIRVPSDHSADTPGSDSGDGATEPPSNEESATTPASAPTAATTATATATEASNSEHTKPTTDEDTLFKDTKNAIDRYQLLISQLPSLNRQLLMYILDLLSIFAAKADENRMPASNLAAIFQPSILSHPSHDMSPEEYHLSRAAIEFLIQHSNKFLSHIEAMAIRKHEEQKKARLATSTSSSDVAIDPTSTDLATTDATAATAPAPTSGCDHPLMTVSNAERRGRQPPAATASFNPYDQSRAGDPIGTVVRRRHSKSLSSVGENPVTVVSGPNGLIPISVTDTSGTNSPRPSVPAPQATLNVPKIRTPGDGGSKSGGGSGAGEIAESPPNTGSGILSTIRRSVSISRRPSQKLRAGSGSSVASSGSNQSKGAPGSRGPASPNPYSSGPRSPELKTPELVEERRTGSGGSRVPSSLSSTSVNGDDGQATAVAAAVAAVAADDESARGGHHHGVGKLSNFFARRSPGAADREVSGGGSASSRAPSSGYFDYHHHGSTPSSPHIAAGSVSSPNASIDQTLAAASPPVPHGVPRAVYSNPGRNESNSSISKTMTGSSVDDLDDDGGVRGPTARADAGQRSKNASKWRRSLQVFGAGAGAGGGSSSAVGSPSEGFGDHPFDGDHLDPSSAGLSTGSLSPTPSGSHPIGSPSKVGGWFRKMRSKEKNLSSLDSD